MRPNYNETEDEEIKQRREFGVWFRDKREPTSRLIHTDPARAMTIIEAACWEAFKKGAEGR